jgi:hypothetical protein
MAGIVAIVRVSDPTRSATSTRPANPRCTVSIEATAALGRCPHWMVDGDTSHYSTVDDCLDWAATWDTATLCTPAFERDGEVALWPVTGTPAVTPQWKEPICPPRSS